MKPDASLLVTLGIPTLALCTLALVALAVWRVSRGSKLALYFALGASTWLAYSACLSEIGLLSRFDLRPPPFLLVMIPMFALAIGLGLSRLGARLAHETPLAWLVGFHGFRLPLELVMHEAAREGVMPQQMTFTGHNFDIVTGSSALLLALLIAQRGAPAALVLAWNALGSLLLAAIAVIAIASLPALHAYGEDPSRLNTWVAFFPFVWLPAGLVAPALFGHIVLWRRLLAAVDANAPTNRKASLLGES
jgi:hypothetical protein